MGMTASAISCAAFVVTRKVMTTALHMLALPHTSQDGIVGKAPASASSLVDVIVLLVSGAVA